MFSNIFGTRNKKPSFIIHNRLENLLTEKGNKEVLKRVSNASVMPSVSDPEVFVTIANRSTIISEPDIRDIKSVNEFKIVVVQYSYEGDKNIILEINPEASWFK